MNPSINLLVRDLAVSLCQWRFWLALGWNDIAKQYRRSFLGPIWITLNTGIFVVAFGFIGAQLFKWDLNSYLPYFAIGHIAFSFFSSVVIEGCQVFIQAEGYLKHSASPKAVHLFRGVTRNLITLTHNALIVGAVLIWSGGWKSALIVHLAIGLTLCSVAALLVMGIVGAISTRFRDIPMIVSSGMQVMFFLTPVMWAPEQLTERAQWVVKLNPFSTFLQLLRDPLLAKSIEVAAYIQAAWIIASLAVIFAAVMLWARPKIVYWL